MITKKPWFKAKRYGWGWTPATWQAWLLLIMYTSLIVLDFYRIDRYSHSVSDTLINFIPDVIILSLILIGLCYLTGESPRWRWGDRK